MRKRFLLLIASLLTIAQGAVAQGIAYVDRSWDDAAKRVVEKIDTCKNYKTFGGIVYWVGTQFLNGGKSYLEVENLVYEGDGQ
jgi:hypothetical protein